MAASWLPRRKRRISDWSDVSTATACPASSSVVTAQPGYAEAQARVQRCASYRPAASRGERPQAPSISPEHGGMARRERSTSAPAQPVRLPIGNLGLNCQKVNLRRKIQSASEPAASLACEINLAIDKIEMCQPQKGDQPCQRSFSIVRHSPGSMS